MLFGGRLVDAEINKTKLLLPAIIWLARLAGKMTLSFFFLQNKYSDLLKEKQLIIHITDMKSLQFTMQS